MHIRITCQALKSPNSQGVHQSHSVVIMPPLRLLSPCVSVSVCMHEYTKPLEIVKRNFTFVSTKEYTQSTW